MPYLFYRLENSTLNFRKRKYSHHEGSDLAHKKMKTLNKLTGGQQRDELKKVVRNDSAVDVKETASAQMCNAKEKMVDEVKQADRDVCTTERGGATVTERGAIVGKLKVEAGGKDEECARMEEGSSVEQTDDQAVPEVSRCDRSPSDQDEDSTDMDEDKRAIRDAEKALRSLSGDWDGDDDFFSSLGKDKERSRERLRKDTADKTGKIVDEGSVIVEPTESTEILVNGKGLCASDTYKEDSKQEAPVVGGGGDGKGCILVAVPSEDHESIEPRDSESRSDDTVEALLKIEQECACIQFLDGQQTPSPSASQPNQHTHTARLSEVQGVGLGSGASATEVKAEPSESAQDENGSRADGEVKSDYTSIEAQILRSNPLLYDKLYSESMRTESDDEKQLTRGVDTDGGVAFGVEHSSTNDLTTDMEKHNGGSKMFASDNSLCDTAQVEAAQMEAAVILQEMSIKTDKEAAAILQQMSIGKRDGNSGLNQSKLRTFSPHEDGDNGGRRFTFLDGFKREMTPAVRPNSLENLHSFHETCKKGKKNLFFFYYCPFYVRHLTPNSHVCNMTGLFSEFTFSEDGE